MARLPLLRSTRLIPWQAGVTLAIQIAKEGRERWQRLTPHEQKRLKQAVTKSRGRIDHLSDSERRELRRILWKAVGPA